MTQTRPENENRLTVFIKRHIFLILLIFLLINFITDGYSIYDRNRLRDEIHDLQNVQNARAKIALILISAASANRPLNDDEKIALHELRKTAMLDSKASEDD